LQTVELRAAMAARHMVRSFRPDAIDPVLVDELLDLARRAPSAGNTQGVSFVVLDGAAKDRYWDVTLPAGERAAFAWPRLLLAPVLVVVLCDPDAYVTRYAEADKASADLGADVASWSVPYWWVDAGCVVQNLLLLATDAGLGALLFGAFEHEQAVLEAFDCDDGRRIAGVVAVGHAADEQRPSRSTQRPRPPLGTIRTRPTSF
jgi:nitroreductase